MNLSKKEIEHIAKLARLELSEDEFDKYGSQLSAILGYIEMLGEVDTSGVEPTAQVTGLVNVLRDDRALDFDSAGRETALKDAPQLLDGFIKVKKVFN